MMDITRPTEEQRVAFCEWLAANGVDVGTVPIDSDFSIVEEADGQRLIHYIEFVVTDDGHKQVDPEDWRIEWKRPATAPCKVEPPVWLNIPGGRS